MGLLACCGAVNNSVAVRKGGERGSGTGVMGWRPIRRVVLSLLRRLV